MPDNTKTLCVLGEAGTRVWPDGRMSPCCINTIPGRHANGEEMFLYKDSLEEAFHSEDFQSLRNNLEAGIKDPRCSVCWDREAVGLESKRQQENRKHPDLLKKIQAKEKFEQPLILDLNIGTTCNLKCRSCGAHSSSRWAQELLDIYGMDGLARNNRELREMSGDESRKLLSHWYEFSEDFWKTLKKWAPKIQVWFFAGGEPLLNKRHLEALRAAIDSGQAHEQVLSYVTNGTIRPSEEIQALWKKFRAINFALSVDGLGKEFEFLRHGAKWEVFLENFRVFRKICTNPEHMVVNYTCSIFNLLSVPAFMEFMLERKVAISLTFVGHPEKLSIQAMPKKLKEKMAELLRSNTLYGRPEIRGYIEQAIEYMNLNDLSSFWPEFLRTVPLHDKYRGENFASTFPQLSTVLDELDMYGAERKNFLPSPWIRAAARIASTLKL